MIKSALTFSSAFGQEIQPDPRHWLSVADPRMGTNSNRGRLAIKVAILSKYGALAAATRQRFRQYEPYFAEVGIDFTYFPLFDDDYLITLFSENRKARTKAAHGYLRRLAALRRMRAFEAAIVHCDLLPYIPGWIERAIFPLLPPTIFDFDDAIFHQYDQHQNRLIRTVMSAKLKPLLRRSRLAVCGNAYLEAYARRFCLSTAIVPTVVDTRVYAVSCSVPPNNKVIIGWIGSPSTWIFLEPLMPLLTELADRKNLLVRIIGAGPRTSPSTRVEFLPWSEHEEVAMIQGMDIGIMPLPDEPWARGKCGYKLIQYMACGLPVIASPVGVNAELVDDGVNGFLATTLQQWRNALQYLAENADLRKSMGDQGRRKIEQEFSLAIHGPRLAGLVHAALADEAASSTRTD